MSIHNILQDDKYGQERIMAQRRRRPVKPLGYVNFFKLIFRPIECLKLIGSWLPERSANSYSVLSKENLTVAITIFWVFFWFEAVARGLHDVSNNR